MQRKREIYCFLEKKKLQLNTALFTVTSLIMTSCCVFHEGGRCDSSGESDSMQMVESPLLNENGIDSIFRTARSGSQGRDTEGDAVLGAVPETGHRVSPPRRVGDSWGSTPPRAPTLSIEVKQEVGGQARHSAQGWEEGSGDFHSEVVGNLPSGTWGEKERMCFPQEKPGGT